MAKFRNKKVGRSECLYILTDKMDPYTLAVYELVKSMGGYDTFDLSIRQIAAFRNMSYGSAQSAFNTLKETGIIRIVKETGRFEADEYEIVDEYLAYQIDPKMNYNKERRKILDSKHSEYKKRLKKAK